MQIHNTYIENCAVSSKKKNEKSNIQFGTRVDMNEDFQIYFYRKSAKKFDEFFEKLKNDNFSGHLYIDHCSFADEMRLTLSKEKKHITEKFSAFPHQEFGARILLKSIEEKPEKLTTQTNIFQKIINNLKIKFNKMTPYKTDIPTKKTTQYILTGKTIPDTKPEEIINKIQQYLDKMKINIQNSQGIK